MCCSESPSFVGDDTRMKQLSAGLGVTLDLECPANGNPPPAVTWRKDGRAVHADDNKYSLQQGGATLAIVHFSENDGGRYECEVYNGVGTALRRSFVVSVSDLG
jgi:hypothetical protein